MPSSPQVDVYSYGLIMQLGFGAFFCGNPGARQLRSCFLLSFHRYYISSGKRPFHHITLDPEAAGWLCEQVSFASSPSRPTQLLSAFCSCDICDLRECDSER